MKVSFNRPEVLYEKSYFRTFAKFTRKHLCQSLFLIKVPQPVTLLKKEALAQVLFCELCDISQNKTPFLTEFPVAASF